jgi:hypothetical protein
MDDCGLLLLLATGVGTYSQSGWHPNGASGETCLHR